jgi:hypothetical protein
VLREALALLTAESSRVHAPRDPSG